MQIKNVVRKAVKTVVTGTVIATKIPAKAEEDSPVKMITFIRIFRQIKALPTTCSVYTHNRRAKTTWISCLDKQNVL